MYLLLPISIITILELECCLASSNQVVRWLNVSLLQYKLMYFVSFLPSLNPLPHMPILGSSNSVANKDMMS